MAPPLALKIIPMQPFIVMVFDIQWFPWKHSFFFFFCSPCIIPMHAFASQRHHKKQPSLTGRVSLTLHLRSTTGMSCYKASGQHRLAGALTVSQVNSMMYEDKQKKYSRMRYNGWITTIVSNCNSTRWMHLHLNLGQWCSGQCCCLIAPGYLD